MCVWIVLAVMYMNFYSVDSDDNLFEIMEVAWKRATDRKHPQHMLKVWACINKYIFFCMYIAIMYGVCMQTYVMYMYNAFMYIYIYV